MDAVERVIDCEDKTGWSAVVRRVAGGRLSSIAMVVAEMLAYRGRSLFAIARHSFGESRRGDRSGRGARRVGGEPFDGG